MRTLFVTLLALIVLEIGTVWAREHWDVAGIEALVIAGHPDLAYSACRGLSSRPLWFLDRADVATRCDAAAREALTAALTAERFAPAAEYCAEILAPPDTGYEVEAKPACRELGLRHTGYIERLITNGNEDMALADVKTAEHL